jgi:RNA polymerase sigma-70 factor (ECF subfamily)
MEGSVRESGVDAEKARERELVRRCVGGDSLAQHELVRRYSALVWSVCRRGGLSEGDAEDVSQEVFWNAFAALERYRGESRLSTWLYTLARRRVVDFHRSPARRNVPSGAPGDADFPPVEGHAPSPEREAQESEQKRRVRRAIDELAEPARSILVAYYLGEMPVLDIARQTGLPEGTVKTHLHRSRQWLRERLKDLC